MSETACIPGHVILTAVVGSSAWGIGPEGDVDYLSVVVEEPPYVTGLRAWKACTRRSAPEGQRSGPGDTDHVYYGLRHFARLAARGNPSILAAFFCSPVAFPGPVAAGVRLREAKDLFISAQALPRFAGYLRSQTQRYLGLRGQRHGARTVERDKYRAHMLRLALQAVELASTGVLSCPMREPDRSLVLQARRGELAHEGLMREMAALYMELQRYLDGRKRPALRPEPAWGAIDALLHEIYTEVWSALPAVRR